jgi:hypothetical protein
VARVPLEGGAHEEMAGCGCVVCTDALTAQSRGHIGANRQGGRRLGATGQHNAITFVRNIIEPAKLYNLLKIGTIPIQSKYDQTSQDQTVTHLY